MEQTRARTEIILSIFSFQHLSAALTLRTSEDNDVNRPSVCIACTVHSWRVYSIIRLPHPGQSSPSQPKEIKMPPQPAVYQRG
jgi:hypothetical protein